MQQQEESHRSNMAPGSRRQARGCSKRGCPQSRAYSLEQTSGQSTLEYGVFIAVVAAALMGMQVYVRRAIQANLKTLEQQINAEEFSGSPGGTQPTPGPGTESGPQPAPVPIPIPPPPQGGGNPTPPPPLPTGGGGEAS